MYFSPQCNSGLSLRRRLQKVHQTGFHARTYLHGGLAANTEITKENGRFASLLCSPLSSLTQLGFYLTSHRGSYRHSYVSGGDDEQFIWFVSGRRNKQTTWADSLHSQDSSWNVSSRLFSKDSDFLHTIKWVFVLRTAFREKYHWIALLLNMFDAPREGQQLQNHQGCEYLCILFIFRDFSWSPGDNIIAFWVPEDKDIPARVTLMQIPTRQEIRVRNLFNVVDCKLHWQRNGDYLCVKVDRTPKGTPVKRKRRNSWDLTVNQIKITC